MKVFCFFLFALTCIIVQGQVISDFNKISLNAYVPEQLNLTSEAKSQLILKLKQIASNYGIGDNSQNPRFIITANLSIGTKDIIAGPPQKIAQNVDITLFIGDAIENKIFSNISLSEKGVGQNENKAFINAISKIDVKNNKIDLFVEEAKNKIISFYSTNCDQIISSIDSDLEKQKFNEALYKLQNIPDVCGECYQKALKKSEQVYQNKIDVEGQVLYDNAKTIWAVSPNNEGAREVYPILLKINKKSNTYIEIEPFIKTVQEKLATDEAEKLKREAELAKRDYELMLERENNNIELEKAKLDAYKSIASEYYKNQPQYQYKIFWVY
jgi:hypothetical protein